MNVDTTIEWNEEKKLATITRLNTNGTVKSRCKGIQIDSKVKHTKLGNLILFPERVFFEFKKTVLGKVIRVKKYHYRR